MKTARLNVNSGLRALAVILPLLLAPGCAGVNAPGGRSVSIPTTTPPTNREQALNELRDPITRVRLGKDVLVPHRSAQDPLPAVDIGPFELRGETLASALQLVLDDYDISLAFESDLAMTTRISVANLHGGLTMVVNRMCDLANLYCSYKDGVLTVKETETFVVDLPPIGAVASAAGGTGASSPAWGTYGQITSGLTAIVSGAPTVDETSRVIIYTATQRTQRHAERYFESLRKNTALIVFETNIWEVALNNENRTGINWNALVNTANFGLEIDMPGGSGSAAPITITPSYTGSDKLTPAAVLEFISSQGTVKTVSQPQLTVLSGSSATLAVTQREDYIANFARTIGTNGSPDTVSVQTGQANSGLTMVVNGVWDNASVYGSISISLDELLALDAFKPDPNTTLQLPTQTTRSLSTQIRVRPGDSILVGGLVTQKDSFDASGPGFMKPLFPTSRSAVAANTELVFLLRPRVVVFVPGDEEDTPPVAVAPGQGAAPVDMTQEVDGLFGRMSGDADAQHDAPQDGDRPVALPGGISPAALAPAQDEPDTAPLPLSVGTGKKDSAGEESKP